MTNILGLTDRWFSTHLQLQLHNRRKVNTTLLDYPVSLELFQVYYSTSRSTHYSHFFPLNFNQHRHQCHLPFMKNSQDLTASGVRQNQRIILHKLHQTKSSKNNYSALVAQKQNKHSVQHLQSPQYTVNMCEWMSECSTNINKVPLEEVKTKF